MYFGTCNMTVPYFVDMNKGDTMIWATYHGNTMHLLHISWQYHILWTFWANIIIVTMYFGHAPW